MKTVIRTVLAVGTLALCAPSQAAVLFPVFSEVPAAPSGTVPGALGPGGVPVVTNWLAIEEVAVSHDGSQWVIKGRTTQATTNDSILVKGSGVTGTMFAQDGQPLQGGAANEQYDFFDTPVPVSWDDAGNIGFSLRSKGGVAANLEKLIKVIGGVHTIVLNQGSSATGLSDLAPNPSGDELFGNSINSVQLRNDGTIFFCNTPITNCHSSRYPALFLNNAAFKQSGVTTIGPDVWDNFDNDGCGMTPDGVHWFAIGDTGLSDITATDFIFAVNNIVIAREGSALGATGIVVGPSGVFFNRMLRNGDYYARGDDTADNDWAIRGNGATFNLIAKTGDPITTGSTELWGNSLGAWNGNTDGDWVLSGNTNNPNTSIDNVLVLNGTTVIARENDPIDLNGNSLPDDDAFIASFQPNDLFITNADRIHVLVTLRNAAGTVIGDAYLQADVSTPPASTPCDQCGPGPHWMHNPGCPQGADTMPSEGLVSIDTNLDCVADQTMLLTGPVTVRRSNPMDDSNSYPGTRPVDGHLDVIDTEILAMNLTGGGVTLTGGANQGQIPLAATLGNIAEQPGNPQLADSFFDVFFEVDLGGGMRVYNQTPLRMSATIDCVSPDVIFNMPANLCIPLYTSPTPGQGVHVANLTRAGHDLFPTPQACCLPNLTCQMHTPLDCLAIGGDPQGEGSDCQTVQCTQACCFPNGTCQDLRVSDCNAQGGQPQGANTVCATAHCANTQPCEACGPGPHWMHNPPCPGRIDLMPSRGTVMVDTNLDCVTDQTLVLNGPTSVRRQIAADDSNSYPGTRPVDGHLDVIDTEMIQMVLTGGGVTITAGSNQGFLPLAATLGNMAEQPLNPGLADSFFDVFFEVDLGGGTRLYNQAPQRFSATANCVPPNTNFVMPTGICIPLYTSPTPGQGVHMANLTGAIHDLFPAPPCPQDIAPPPNGDGVVGVPDLLRVINNWGPCPNCPQTPCSNADINNDCAVGVPDLLQVINNWGPCPQ